jgi:hypothetical protein
MVCEAAPDAGSGGDHGPDAGAGATRAHHFSTGRGAVPPGRLSLSDDAWNTVEGPPDLRA